MRNFLKTKLSRIKNTFKKPSNMTFGKIGLFLIFGLIMLNLNLRINEVISFDSRYENKISINLVNTASAEGWGTIIDRGLRYAPYIGPIYTSVKGAAGEAGNILLWAFNWLLFGVLAAITKLLVLSGQLFDYAINPTYLSEMVKADVVYKAWAAVRDLLNMFFILFLLFSAFATIFQVEKYHLRKIIIMLVVMALLVNFSYPITLFVIDFSNSLMDFLLTAAFPDDGISKSAVISHISKFGEVTRDFYDDKSFFGNGDVTSNLIVSIVFTFIYFLTIAALALNLLIRMIAFSVLLILSPAGFVFVFFPSTSSMASSWWDSLFKYAMTGPILVFFIMLANLLFGTDLVASDPTSNTAIPISIICIVFLWMGLTISQKYGGEASGVAMGIAKKTGNNIKGYGQKMAWGTAGLAGRGVDTMTGHRISGGVGAVKSRLKQVGDDYKSKSEARAAQLGDKIGVRGAKEKDMKRRAEEYKKNLAQPDELKNLAKKGDAAAAYRLAEDKDMNQETYDEFMKTNKDDSLRKSINSKTKQTRMDLVAVNTAETTLNDAKKLQDFKNKNHSAANMNPGEIKKLIVEQEMSKLGAEDFANQDWKSVSEQVDALTRDGKTADATIIKDAVHKSFTDLTDAAKNEAKKRLNGQKVGELRSKFSITIV